MSYAVADSKNRAISQKLSASHPGIALAFAPERKAI
jgi:hypothetical protein